MIASLSPTRKRTRRSIGVVVAVVIATFVAIATWYVGAIRPVNQNDTTKRGFVVATGTTPDAIGAQLKAAGLIRSELAYKLYVRLHTLGPRLQAGSYKLAPSESLSAIMSHLQKGEDDLISITFYPGATLYDTTDIADSKRTDVYTMLRRAGYGDDEIRSALSAHYDHPLLADKPADVSLEGYIYGETYLFPADTSVEDIVQHTFDVYYQVVKDTGLIEAAKQRGYNLHQALTLASVVQREVSDFAEQRQVAQVFYSRLDAGMPLGSDVTAIYASNIANQPRSIDIDSPYNTRKYAGLPPGPIAAPGRGALEAVADPADGDYLFFVAGDDGKTYFSHTKAEHDENVAKHCIELCREL